MAQSLRLKAVGIAGLAIVWTAVALVAGAAEPTGTESDATAAVGTVPLGALEPGAEVVLDPAAAAPASPLLVAPQPLPVDRVATAWSQAQPTLHARTAALRRLRLEYGLGDLRAPALAIQAAADPEEPEIANGLARELAPHMPALAYARVENFWRAGAVGEAVRASAGLVAALFWDLESQLWLLANALQAVLLVALVAGASVMLMLAAKAFPDAAHDLGDPLSRAMPGFARAALLAGCLLVPLFLGEGLTGFLLACFAVAFVYGGSSERTALVAAAIAWVVAVHPLARGAAVASAGVELDPLARSALAVLRGTPARADLDRLDGAFADDLLAAHAVVQQNRRVSLDGRAAERLVQLAERHPRDAVVLANRANVEMRAGRVESAIDYYERAVAETNSPETLFSLSQAYASALRIDDAEAALLRAQRVGDREVAALSSLSDPKLVADLPLPSAGLRDRIRAAALSAAPTTPLALALAPGRLGRDVPTLSGAFVAVALVGVFAAKRFERASVCSRCGHRICTRCESNVWSEDLCEACHHLFKNADATDPKLRMARLQILSRRESLRGLVVTLASVCVPGVAGLAVRRPDIALAGVALFAWGAAWLRWPAGRYVDSTWLGELAPTLVAISGVVAFLGYAATIAAGFVLRRNR